MSQQINLINPDLRKKREWLTATSLAIATGVMLVIVVISAVFAKQRADTRFAEAEQRAATLKTSQDRLAEMSKSVANLKPNQQLADELANSRALLNLREEVMAALEGGAFSNNAGFAEYFRGFARQTPPGLWLTGFTIGSGGEEMEILGRMLNPAALPEYIQRLNGEKAFQGRSFATLTIQRPEVKPGEAGSAMAPTTAPVATPGTAPTSAASLAPAAPVPLVARYVEFRLTAPPPEKGKGGRAGVSQGGAAESKK